MFPRVDLPPACTFLPHSIANRHVSGSKKYSEEGDRYIENLSNSRAGEYPGAVAHKTPDDASLRLALRQHTDQSHRRLDAAIGQFGDLAQYGAFVTNSFRFRQLVEPMLENEPLWMLQSLLTELRLDLDDLQLSVPEKEASLPAELSSPSARIGAFYVLEGSALGARLLFQRALSLGLGGTRGARHLARQAGDTGRWREFLHLLDTNRDIDRPAALAGARIAFDQALRAYAVPA